MALDGCEDLSSHGIVFPIAEYEVLIGHLEKCINNELNTLGWRESCPRVEILSRSKRDISRQERLAWSKKGGVSRWIYDL